MRFINYFFILFFIFSAFGCQTTGRYIFHQSGYGNYKDIDWNETFYANARLPSKNSIEWISEEGNQFLRFRLKDKDKGWSHTDRKARHSAPYWERAEVKQRKSLNKSNLYEIDFLVRFVEGFNGNRENFFQIHQSNDGCRISPVIMLKFSEVTMFGEWTFNISENKGKWINFNILLDLNNQSYTIKIDNKLFVEDRGFRKPLKGCGIPHIKFGIYRPGNIIKPNNLSIVDFDKIQIKEIKIKDGKHYFNSLSDKMICYRHGFYDGRYVTEAKRRGIKCS